LDLSNTSVADLSPLRGIPLGWLEINRWSGFTATNDGVTDLSPLAGAPLAGFCAYGQQHLEDISPLRGCPLRQLYLAGTGVSDLSPVVGAPLAALFLGDRCSGSFGAVRGMPLRVLNVAGCSSLTDLGPIEDCTQLEVLFTPKGRPPVPASLTTKLTKLKQVNPADGDTLAKASREAILQAIRDEWQEGLASPVAPQTTVLLTLAKPILAGRAADALQRWREKGEELGQGLAEEQRQTVAAQLDALAGMERQILTSLRADLGKTLEIELAEEKITGEVREVTADGIRVMQTVKQGQGTARLARTIRLTQLGIAERLRRLGPGDTAELNLQRGLLALEAARPDTARKLFEKAGGPLGDALAAELRTRQADARENAAEQAVVELLRQVSTAAKLEGKDKVVAAIRKRCGDDLKRVQAARKELAGFEKDYGETAAGKEWAPMVRRGLTYPIAGDVVLRVPDLGLELVPIAAGEFTMGSNTPGASACQPVHRARLSRPLWMGKYEVTQAEFEAVTGRNPSRFRGPRMPVETLAWDDTTAFCRELTRMEQAAGWLPDGFEFRLPTEAEWEYACRAGDNGESAADLSQVAWFSGNSGGQGHEVGQKKANPWGLYDLYGNVWERCLDYSAAGYYASSPAVDPVCLGPATACRVCRGGGYADDAATVTAWYRRLTWAQSAAIAELGFRVVLAAPLPATAP